MNIIMTAIAAMVTAQTITVTGIETSFGNDLFQRVDK